MAKKNGRRICLIGHIDTHNIVGVWLVRQKGGINIE